MVKVHGANSRKLLLVIIFLIVATPIGIWYAPDFYAWFTRQTTRQNFKEIVFIIDKTEPYEKNAAAWAEREVETILDKIFKEQWNLGPDNTEVNVYLEYWVIEPDPLDPQKVTKGKILLSRGPITGKKGDGTSYFGESGQNLKGLNRDRTNWLNDTDEGKKFQEFKKMFSKESLVGDKDSLSRESRLFEAFDNYVLREDWNSELKLESKLIIISDLLECSSGSSGIIFKDLSTAEQQESFQASGRARPKPKMGKSEDKSEDYIHIFHLYRRNKEGLDPLPFWKDFYLQDFKDSNKKIKQWVISS